MQFIGINGPPHCGKDTAGAMLAEYLRSKGIPATTVKLAAPLRDIAFRIVPGYNDASYESFKVTKHEILGGTTGRQLMIDISERFLKRLYGQTIMTQMLLAYCKERDFAQQNRSVFQPPVNIITDMGFQSEADEIVLQHHDLVVCQMTRPGCSFKGDSRSTVFSPVPGIESFTLNNDGTIDELRQKVANLGRYAIKQLGF